MNESSELEFDRAACVGRILEAVPRQVDLARELGITPSAISNVKKRGSCSVDMVAAACRLTGKSADWFLFGKDRAGS